MALCAVREGSVFYDHFPAELEDSCLPAREQK